MVAFAHSNGSLVTFNHPLEEAPSGPELAALLIETRSLGADMVEIGSKEDFVQSVHGYDAALRNGVFVTATGVSDDHGGQDWINQKQRWITSVWADSTDEADLFKVLRGGRAWFYDPKAWRGELDFRVLGNVPMGSVVVTPAQHAPIDLRVTDLPAGAVVKLVTGVVDYAGLADPTPNAVYSDLGVNGSGKSAHAVLDTSRSVFVRVEVRDVTNAVIGFSNPVWILKDQPAGGIPNERLGRFGWAD